MRIIAISMGGATRTKEDKEGHHRDIKERDNEDKEGLPKASNGKTHESALKERD